jgi:hypothetical protein
MKMNEMMLRIIGLFVGLLLRLMLPAVYTWYNTENFEWDHKYSRQFILSVIIAFAAVVAGYTAPPPNLTPSQVFWTSIQEGVLLEEAINQVRKWDDLRITKMLAERTPDD